MTELLYDIQRLQFSDRSQAESLLLSFIRQQFELDVVRVELRPLAVSLNSFNGFITLADSTRLFFKSHVESGAILNEYYNASELAACGYPMIQPLFQSTEAGRQLLIYEMVSDPTVFDVAWQIEQGDVNFLPTLTRLQNESDDLLFQLYQKTFEPQTAEAAARSSVHQLFYHRLTGERLNRFYADTIPIQLPDATYSMGEIRSCRWIINGIEYGETLNNLIDSATKLLQPGQSGPSILGHGDAHNGNVFMRTEGLVYFDPAFAGRHHPLLDLTKPLFHNVYAMWMYYPHEKAAQTHIKIKHTGNWIEVEHNYQVPHIRQMFLKSKVERVLKPIISLLNEQGMLRPDWTDYLKAALFCCPLLTMPLTNHNRFPPSISLLGLSMAIIMGGKGISRASELDQQLQSIL